MAGHHSFMAVMAAMYPLMSSLARAGSLADIDHVVLFMQENRAFDHYFGTMAGVRGYMDPNVQVNGKLPVWNQLTSNASSYLTPWYLNYLAGTWPQATQCMTAGSNGWEDNHAAWNHGTNDHWALNNTPWSWAYYQKQDLPIQFALAEGWTVGDMYQESVVASTNPNRVTWVSGSINVPGSPQTANEGGYPYIDNNETPGCESGGFNCYPLKWKTAPEYYEAAGVTWQVYQDEDNFDDNPLAWFDQFQNAPQGSSLFKRGFQGLSLDTFYAQAANGTLPEISYIIGPTELSEHPPYSPHDGAWLQKQVAEAVIKSPKYARTALIISWDETGGWGDHVNPYRSPDGTPGEWIDDPYKLVGHTFAGPGFRLPFYIISPWTRGGAVFTEHADHNSQILFIERWQAAKGKNVTTGQMVPWRREHMSDLVSAFDFEHPDYSLPVIPDAPAPHENAQGVYDGSSYCESLFAVRRPPVPYGEKPTYASDVQEGFKSVRGALTEGRYLVFEAAGLAPANKGKDRVVLTPVTPKHESASQRWIIYAQEVGSSDFTIKSAVDGRYICAGGKLCRDAKEALVFETSFVAGKGHHFVVKGSDKCLGVGGDGLLNIVTGLIYWKTFSVTYH